MFFSVKRWFVFFTIFLNLYVPFSLVYAAPEKPGPASYSNSAIPTIAYDIVETEDQANSNVRLQEAMSNPEYMLGNWINLPTAPGISNKKLYRLSLREAILLALRYNPNIQNAELDRIIQRYQLRLSENQYELQYALAGSATTQRSRYQGVGSRSNDSILATPEVNLKTLLGSQLKLNLQNNTPNYNAYTPVINFSLTQPLLRGFGLDVNQTALLNAQDNEWLNKLNLKQSIIDQITQVIIAYRSLILSGNSLENQRLQLKEARKTYEVNEKKIEAGHLAPTANIQQSYQVESLSLMVEQGENDFKTATQNLLQAIGLDPRMRLAVPNDITLGQMIVPDLKETLQIALNNNVQYLAQKRLICADERAYKVAQNDQLWQLDLFGSAEFGKTTDPMSRGFRQGIRNIFGGENLITTGGINLRIPIRDMNLRSEVINAKVKLEKDRLSLITMKHSLETQVTTLINNMESLAKRYLLIQKQVKLAVQSYDLEKKKLSAGIASALDLSNTQNQLIQAQIGLISAKIAYLNQLAALQQLLGTTLDYWKIKLRYCG